MTDSRQVSIRTIPASRRAGWLGRPLLLLVSAEYGLDFYCIGRPSKLPVSLILLVFAALRRR